MRIATRHGMPRVVAGSAARGMAATGTLTSSATFRAAAVSCAVRACSTRAATTETTTAQAARTGPTDSHGSGHSNSSKPADGKPISSSAASASASSSSSSKTDSGEALGLTYRPRWRYAAPFRSKSMLDFVCCRQTTEHAVSIAHTYKHPVLNITVTLIPLRHFAHPEFFRQVDDLCCQHESVLMEGRMPLSGAPFSTLVPPRERISKVRPPDHEDDEGWEPREVVAFFQPFSWGVRDSPNFTVIHAADKYDYERLPLWCSVRFNVPILGSLAREKHCLDMMMPLKSNGYTSFAVPWGAAHMPIFHEMLVDNGFEPIGMCSLLMLSRIDGPTSEAEYDTVWRWQRRRARLETLLHVLAAFAVVTFVISYARVEYRQGPPVGE